MRTKIITGLNSVLVTREDESGALKSTVYFVPSNGGYVRIRDAAGRFPQVCEKLYSTGNTIEATPETLGAVIRRELRRRQRDEKKQNF